MLAVSFLSGSGGVMFREVASRGEVGDGERLVTSLRFQRALGEDWRDSTELTVVLEGFIDGDWFALDRVSALSCNADFGMLERMLCLRNNLDSMSSSASLQVCH